MGKSMDDNFLELPFDQLQRYLVLREIADVLRDSGGALHILDVGGYLQTGGQDDFAPAYRMLPDDDIVVLDIKFKGPGKYVVGSGFALPFRDGAFHLAACMDTLEHIPRDHRADFVRELKRVSENVLIVGPVKHDLTDLAERILDSFIKTALGVEHPALHEHLSYGLPASEDIEAWLSRPGREIIQAPDGFLPNWLFMMLLKHVFYAIYKNDTQQRELDRFYNSIFRGTDRREPAYRRIMLSIVKEKADLARSRLSGELRGDSVVSEAFGYALSNLILMNESAKLNLRLNEIFSRQPNWIELKELAEERLRLIEVKDELLQRQSYMLAEAARKNEEHIQRISELIREKQRIEKETEKLLSERQKLLEEKEQTILEQQQVLEEQQQSLQELFRFRDKVQRTWGYRLYRFIVSKL